jgi:hypothetical protein
LFAGRFVNRGGDSDDRIIREAAMLCEVDHPGLVKGYRLGLPSSPDEPILILMD